MKIKTRAIETVEEGTIIKQVAGQLNIPETTVKNILDSEFEITRRAINSGKKIIKKNYLTFVPRLKKARDMVSPVTKKTYHVEEKRDVTVHIGAGFKAFICNKKMPEKICRFVKNA